MPTLTSTELKRLHREWRRRTPARLSVALDGVSGPFNVGSILRTAAAYRARTVWLDEVATGPDNPKVGKTALGSERFVEVIRVSDGPAMADAARADGYRVVGIELSTDARPLHEVDLVGDICIMVGHEDRGIRGPSVDACDEVAFIPQLGRIGSLNVAIAMAIASYEWARQQWVRESVGPSPEGQSHGVDEEP